MKGKGRKGGRVGVVWGKEKGGGEGGRVRGGGGKGGYGPT